MDIHGYLTLLCAVLGAMALIGYGMSLAGVTRAQRTVRVMGRIERVREPRHGSSQHDGIPVVVSFCDPSTGQEFTVTNDDEHGDRISTAWTGREIGVRYQQGRPHTYRFTHDLWANRHGRAWPNSAVFLLYAGLVVLVAIDWGWPWALLGFAGPWSVAAARYLPGMHARRGAASMRSPPSPSFRAEWSPSSRTPAPTKTATPPPATHQSSPSPPMRARPSPPTALMGCQTP